jgi:hypothetical protein
MNYYSQAREISHELVLKKRRYKLYVNFWKLNDGDILEAQFNSVYF